MASKPLQQPKSATTVFLDQPPSCLEFCPASPNRFIVGTYLLSESKTEDGDIQQEKTGSVQLWKLDTELNTFALIQRISVPYAVFDLHFHSTDPNLFAIASSGGSIDLFRLVLSESTSDPEIIQLWSLPVRGDPSTPALFLAWAPRGWFLDDRDGFAVTFSDGRTSVFGTNPGGKDITQLSNVRELGTFDAREPIEVWFVALAACHGKSVEGNRLEVPYMFTGNDFGSLHTRRFDTALGPGEEQEDQEEDESEKVLPSVLLDHEDRGRHHSAGVTFILPLPLPLLEDAQVLLTGSYDEYLRVYHATMKGKVLAEVCLGGGVWRLQLLHTETVGSEGEGAEWRFLVLASCMHAGTRVVRVTRRHEDQWEIDVLAEFTEHESMNYASGVWKGSDEKQLVCVSSSFYDRRLCLWRVEA